MMVAASAFLTPASCPRLRPLPAAHILLHCINTINPKSKFHDRSFKSSPPSPSLAFFSFPPLILRPTPHQLFLNPIAHSSFGRLFCSQALSADAETGEKARTEAGEVVRKFKMRLRIADVRGGADEGLDMVGQNITIKGWVRTCRVQSSVTFIEVNDGSCLSNMQCVINSSSEGYNEVESGNVGLGASVVIEGTLVRSEGSKQKVELKVARLAVVDICENSC